MTARGAGPETWAESDSFEWAGLKVPRRRVRLIVVLAAAGLALGLSLYELLEPGRLLGRGNYDEAVYLGAAIRMAVGQLPYRDFALVQPPGLPVFLLPIGFLARGVGAREAMALARLTIPVVMAVDVVLLGWVLRHRSLPVVTIACVVMATLPASVLTSGTLYLEPFLVLPCLVGTAFLFEGDSLTASSSRLFWGGFWFGLAGTVKVWAIFPVLVLVLLLLRPRGRRLVGFVLGLVVGFALVCGFFFLESPSGFLNQVVIGQLVRHDISGVPLLIRLETITGVVLIPVVTTAAEQAKAVAIGAVAVFFVAVAYLGLPEPHRAPPRPSSWWGRVKPTQLEAYALLSTVVIAIAFAVPQDFFFHYDDFLAPFLSLTLAFGAQRWLRVGGQPGKVIMGLAMVGLVLNSLTVPPRGGAGPNFAVQFDRVVPRGPCVLSDDPTWLVYGDRMPEPLARCPAIIDPFGYTLVLSRGHVANAGAGRSHAAVAAWLGDLRRAEYLVLSPVSYRRIPWTPRLVAYVHRHFVVAARSPTLILRRTAVVRTRSYGLPTGGVK